MDFAKRKSLFFLFLALVPAFFGCSARLDGALKAGGAADLNIRTSLEPGMVSLLRSLQAIMGESPAQNVLDGPGIGRSMAGAPGINSAELHNTGPAALEGRVTISKAEDFLSIAGRDTRFISYQEAFTGGKSSGTVVIFLDRESAPEIVALLSMETADYLSALLAPVATGEELSRGEYLELVGSLYGKTLADEIAAARIGLSLSFPGPVSSVQGGTFSGPQAEFSIPLLDLLVLDSPLRYEVRW
jgi:hypothetical protein